MRGRQRASPGWPSRSFLDFFLASRPYATSVWGLKLPELLLANSLPSGYGVAKSAQLLAVRFYGGEHARCLLRVRLVYEALSY